MGTEIIHTHTQLIRAILRNIKLFQKIYFEFSEAELVIFQKHNKLSKNFILSSSFNLLHLYRKILSKRKEDLKN